MHEVETPSLFLRHNCPWERGRAGTAVSNTQKQYMVCKQKMRECLISLAEGIQGDRI